MYSAMRMSSLYLAMRSLRVILFTINAFPNVRINVVIIVRFFALVKWQLYKMPIKRYNRYIFLEERE